MGTRGIFGIRKNGKDKITYNHWDSYPDCLGRTMLEFCAKTSADEVSAIFDRIELVSEMSTPTDEQIAACAKYTDLTVSEQSEKDWYCLLRKLQGKPEAWKEISGTIYMIDSWGFMRNSLFCEYGYIINLDKGVLEFWRGFQNDPQEGNRFGETPDDDGYYPCKLAAEIPLAEITWARVNELVEQMNACER